MNTNIDIHSLQDIPTPYYLYDEKLLRATLQLLCGEVSRHEGYVVHYAVKANTHPQILRIINEYGIGIDCVSGGEIQAALDAGFEPSKIVYAGVGKSDREIELGLQAGIFCFNVESVPELEVIEEIAARLGVSTNVCFRINPEVGAHTHHNIATGNAEDKFGIAMSDMESVIRRAQSLPHIHFLGLHFHIGSQILDMTDFEDLCKRINELQTQLDAAGITLEVINVGGGLGIDYNSPDEHPIPDFQHFFDTYASHLQLRPGQTLHFELGRSIVAQCGSLLTRVLYVKQGAVKKFVIVDAGMTDLIRPALYNAHHAIENLTPHEGTDIYDVVGPICESSDVFDKDMKLPTTQRGDLLAIRSAGAYGEIMASGYNCRPLPKGYLK